MNSDAQATVLSDLPDCPTEALLDLIDDNDPHVVPDIFNIVCLTDAAHKIPPDLRSLPVLAGAFRLRVIDSGFDVKV